ncbi:MAG TPA: DNA-binding protein [Bacteroidales bacterium]|nr:DNA-binding protein [Bacteroidales bacterium]
MEGQENKSREREEIFSISVRAGKRTYFFDVKATRRNDYYLTVTESKKRFNRDGRYYFEKHKLFLYKEDFEKFAEGLAEAVEYIKNNQPELLPGDDYDDHDEFDDRNRGENGPESRHEHVRHIELSQPEVKADKEFTNVEFEDLDEK